MNAPVNIATKDPSVTIEPLLDIRSLSFRYGQKVALDDISFQLQAGRFHALLGPNGAGKSTLFNLISRLYQLQNGDILLQGQSLKNSSAELLGNVGMVFQQSTLDLELSVAENLYYHGSLQGMSRRHCRQRMIEELAQVDMSEHLKTKVRNLNGGHRRRVEIARALLHQPQLLLLDEATVGLDPDARKGINQHVRKLCQQQKLGVLWATHLIEEIDADDPVTLLHQGKVKANDCSRAICQQCGVEDLTHAFEQLTRKATNQERAS
ncbi:MAG: ATP-binding cassette domain-containing protein [Motiliproteus sp.]